MTLYYNVYLYYYIAYWHNELNKCIFLFFLSAHAAFISLALTARHWHTPTHTHSCDYHRYLPSQMMSHIAGIRYSIGNYRLYFKISINIFSGASGDGDSCAGGGRRRRCLYDTAAPSRRRHFWTSFQHESLPPQQIPQ